MTAADRNTTADAATVIARDRAARQMRSQPNTIDHGAAYNILEALDAAGYDVVARTPDTTTASDTAARARALLHAATPGPWDQVGATVEKEGGGGWCVVVADCDKVPDAALIAAAPTLITDLLAELCQWQMSDALQRDPDAQQQFIDSLLAERVAAVARADAAEAEATRLRGVLAATQLQLLAASEVQPFGPAADRGTDR